MWRPDCSNLSPPPGPYQAVCASDKNYVMWDFLAMLLLGFVWRLIAFVVLWNKLRPEVGPGLRVLLREIHTPLSALSLIIPSSSPSVE